MSEHDRTADNLPEILQGIFQKYPGNQGDLIPILQDIQAEVGYIPREAMSRTARFLNICDSTVYGVVTFYAQFYLTPQGRHKIRVCLGTACHVRKGKDIMTALERKLGIKSGQTTDDLEFSLERVACFGSCALGPVVVVDGKVHGKMTRERAEGLLGEMR
ncbi:MAG: NADH-quinone oxidoreductase subunit NuoE [Planctomycetota bacterium]